MTRLGKRRGKLCSTKGEGRERRTVLETGVVRGEGLEKGTGSEGGSLESLGTFDAKKATKKTKVDLIK